MSAAPLPLTALTALSPLDGRYGRAAAPLREVFSEYAFMRARLRVEVEWLIGLARLRLPELPELPASSVARLHGLVEQFSLADCDQIKAIERDTNHDVKAVEYWVKRRTADVPELARASEFIHF
ncbi:MAG: adenylosuccinate lyase, partial [Burkholderiales bacterium]|nr:adenylosuccinate lyase [Burkholderiales bacterium]